VFSHPFRKRYSRVEDGAWEQKHEFFAAVTADTVDFAGLVLENLRELLEDSVTRLVAMRVVHALEMIQVAHHTRKGLVQPARVLEHLDQPLLEIAPIIETREWVSL
jgi:hypothetical protein